MKLKQLSVFLENKPGRLSEPCQILAEAGVNIFTLSLADTQQFGILRLIVSDEAAAREALENAGAVVNETEVVALEVEDKPGGLENVLKEIESCGINVEYMYAFTTFSQRNRAILVFRFENPDRAVSELQGRGVNIVDSAELNEMMKGV